MAQRIFKLPGAHQLTKDQELARSLPLDGQYLVIGGPGTGKSVVALLRVKQLADQNKNYIFLVFNHLLKHSCFLLAGQKLVAEQWQKWFIDLYSHAFNKAPIPRLPKEANQKYADFDWEMILNNANERGPVKSADELPYIVIDEGQDMPREFYQALAALGYENFFVVADQNQQIISGRNSPRQDIEDALCIEPDEVVELRTNHRNNYSVARLARKFYTGDPASPPPELPEAPKYNILKPLLFNFRAEHFNAICKRIVLMAQAHSGKLIGVLTANNNVRERYLDGLQAYARRVEKQAPLISTYQYSAAENIPFDQGGIMVINAQACKGLEFDYVFISDIDAYHGQDLEHLKKLFYVMTSRAIERVFLLSGKMQNYPVHPLIPENADVLEIK